MKQIIKVNHILCIDKKKNYMKIMLKNTNKSQDNLKATIRWWHNQALQFQENCTFVLA